MIAKHHWYSMQVLYKTTQLAKIVLSPLSGGETLFQLLSKAHYPLLSVCVATLIRGV